MKRALAACVLVAGSALPASAHIALSTVDVHVRSEAVEVTVSAQAYDLGHDLGIDPPERLMDPPFLLQERDAVVRLLESGLTLSADGDTLAPDTWSAPVAVPEQQLVRIGTRYKLAGRAGRLTIASRLFSYDSQHQTIVNIFEGDTLRTQQMLDAGRPALDYFTATRAGLSSILRRFTLAGMQRALGGYDHWLFVAALCLMGGAPRRLWLIVGAFTISCGVGLALGVSHVLAVPATIVAPAAALSVVYAGVDNLVTRGGRDMRAWTALLFGWAHGFSFASALGAMDHPLQWFGWAAVSYGAGVEWGVLLVGAGVTSIFTLAAMRHAGAKRALVTACSIGVALAGAVSFVHAVLQAGGRPWPGLIP